jgi:hypothetical protein
VPNGLPQPGDALVVILAPLVLLRWNGRMSRPMRELVRPLMIFTGYVILVNLYWSVTLGTFSFNLKTGFAMSPVFYIYNGIMFLVALVMFQKHGERFIHHTVRMVVVSVLVQVLVSFVYSRHGRGTVLFNNPNQLGYYAVLSALIILIGQKRVKMSSLFGAIGLMAAVYLALLSASKAAIACIMLVLALGLLERMRTIIFSGLVALVLMVTSNPVGNALDNARARMESDKKLDFAEERGYDRISEHPENWLLGAGEGDYHRYVESESGHANTHELHSSLGTIFFCYGIVGSLLFLNFAVRVIRRAPLRRMIMMTPVLAYGLSHQGMRFTLLWMLFALYVALNEKPAVPVGLAAPPGPRPTVRRPRPAPLSG